MEFGQSSLTSNETDPFQERSEAEIISFLIIQGTLIFIRFLAIIYFILMAI